MNKFIKKCPLTFSIIIAFIAVNVCGCIAIYKKIIPFDISITHPVVASVFEYVSDKTSNTEFIYDETPIEPIDSLYKPDEDNNVLNTTVSDEENNEESKGDKEQDDEMYAQESEKDSNYGKVVYTERISSPPRSPYYDEVNIKASSTQFDYSTVDKEYFSNTLFIGDSRIEGLCRYGGIDTASYCFKSGVSVWDIREQSLFDGNFNKTTLDNALNLQKFDYIYIMIGINELGRGTPTSYANQYKEDIKYIKQCQPEATIIIMGILGITQEYSDNSDVYNNDNVNARNVSISYLSNGTDVFYLDVNDSVCDSQGAMIEEYSRDGIHLKAEYYTLWADYLCSHAIVR